MNNTASVLVLVFLAITFIMSAHEKIFHWNDSMSWMKPHFEKTILKNYVPIAAGVLVFFELLAGILCIVGIVELYINGGRMFGFYGAVYSCITLLFMLFGQRLAKDIDGARTIAIYFVVAILGVFWLS
ncbi:DoxX family membrane protein [Flavobacterium sp. SUN052]|uniref:DoxX family membrane protein n=1 Tax=Flavobacterium sp. SUN052 TaxID=3002441 RepID=UPI00237E7408|nr:DoxX family membrane protein [Flavobacterium sp. SUN052]MEC4003559.1 DoxX family membrane protein [Flavobacterium sp. SUN052]